MERIDYRESGHLAIIELCRPDKRNAFDSLMLRELAEAYTRFEETPTVRCALLCARGDHFTGGLDLGEVGPRVAAGQSLFPLDAVDPFDLGRRRRTKPVVAALNGYCLTIGVELALAADVRIASDDCTMSQIEVARGIYPFGGATLRFPQVAGWSNAMRWLLTGDFWGANEALRMGLVSELTPADKLRDRATQIAKTIAAQAPLAVRATLASAKAAITDGFDCEAKRLTERAMKLFETADAAEGMRSFLERRTAVFSGE